MLQRRGIPLSLLLDRFKQAGVPPSPSPSPSPSPPPFLPPCPPAHLQLADVVEALLEDPAALAAVGRRAKAKARSWTERDNALALVRHVQQALGLER